MKMQWLVIYPFIIALFIFSCGQIQEDRYEQLKVNYTGDAKIEVGGPYAGVEFHHSSCMPQRISFYYPVANSIDISSDYWQRDTTFVMAAGLKFGNEEKTWLGIEPLAFSLTPYRVEFTREDTSKNISIRYQFAKTKPVLILTFSILNKTSLTQAVEFETHLETSLRTSHSFNRTNRAWTKYDPVSATVFTYHTDRETDEAVIFVSNTSEKPVAYHTRGPLQPYPFKVSFDWNIASILIPKELPAETATRFLYRKELEANKNLEIVQVIGMTKSYESGKIAAEICDQYPQEVASYENSILKKAFAGMPLETGNPDLNHAVSWARAIMNANEHYLDEEFVPMPCPAEYNFYFTHDVLVSDLAAVHFDNARVRRDLGFIIEKARPDSVIPHAYYWKDSTFVTEWADSDNWNNFWMIITTASYLRHSADTSFVSSLYPYLKKCLKIALLNQGDDNLMWTFQPDWWDIGRNYAPRSYMSILTVKAIRDFIYIATILDKSESDLLMFSNRASQIIKAITDKLWLDDFQYLMNYYEDKTFDPHYYIGSLLAVHYNVIDTLKQKKLIETAGKKMLDPKVGIYCAYPMDFAGLIDYLKFSGNEAGAPYYYLNGGIWPQGNAWYALALIAVNRHREAANFLRETMTIKGVMAGPRGQPAMYEVRNANRNNPDEYGTVDKPQFMWSGAWYLYTLYHLLGFYEDEWNLGMQISALEPRNENYYQTYLFGQKVMIKRSGQGSVLKKITYDNQIFPSLIVPHRIPRTNEIELVYGSTPTHPYLKSTNAVLISASFDAPSTTLNLLLKAFPGYKNETKIAIHADVNNVSCDGLILSDNWRIYQDDLYRILQVSTIHTKTIQHLSISFR